MGPFKFKRGFTLVEILLAVAILALALCSILAAYISCFVLTATSKNVNIATNAALGLIEEIRSHRDPCPPYAGTISFTRIVNDYNCSQPGVYGYHGLAFNVNGIPQSMGVVYIDDRTTKPSLPLGLLEVTISVCWRQGNRVIGEDTDLDGILDAGEDKSSPLNGIIDSPVQLVTRIANR